MKVILADHAGFCFGVKNIDKLTRKAIEDNTNVFSYGQLIHNKDYQNWALKNGLRVLNSIDKLPEGSQVLVRAHGIKKEERIKLEQRAELIDGTCPVLLNIYEKIVEKYKLGYKIVIYGDKNHPEIVAMNSYIDDEGLVVADESEAKTVKGLDKLFIISQTTYIREKFDKIGEILKNQNTNVEISYTICNATRIRQEEAEELSKRVDCMLIIGGKNSSNTDKLYKISLNNCKNSYKIENIEDISLQKLAKFNTIGVTAGASTPQWIIEEVVTRMDNFSNEEFMEQVEDSMIKVYPKEIVKGTVINVKDEEVFVDIKFRSDGIIKKDEMTEEEANNPQACFQEGEEIDVYIIKLDDGEGNVVLSTRRVEGLKNWKKLAEKFENDEIVEVDVIGENSGGLVVSVMGINGFIPASQIATYFVKNFKQFVDQKLKAKIISIDEKKRRIVLSSRAVIEDEQNKAWEKIVVGEKITGKVVRMTDFGAFVDLGGVDALVHVSDIAWQRIEKPSDVLEIGQEIEAVVLKANRERNRISLGIKQLTKKPFELFIENNKVGDVVKGKVVNLLDFGAFIRLKEGVEGLIHVSQISYDHIEKPSDVLNIGDEVEAKILEIEEDRQRIALSIKALQEAPKREERPARPKREVKKNVERPTKPKKEAQAKDNNFGSDSFGNSLGDLIALKLEEADSNEADEAIENKTASEDEVNENEVSEKAVESDLAENVDEDSNQHQEADVNEETSTEGDDKSMDEKDVKVEENEVEEAPINQTISDDVIDENQVSENVAESDAEVETMDYNQAPEVSAEEESTEEVSDK